MSYERFKTSMRRSRNLRRWAKESTEDLRDDVSENWGERSSTWMCGSKRNFRIGS
jgi:hypothetical protein